MDGHSFMVGTCGYSYAEWKESFYPRDLRQQEYLKYYSLVFPFVELDFSWYAMPKAQALSLMADSTNPDFHFSMKAHRSLTHEITEDWPSRAEELCQAAEALASRNKLAAILIQLPYRFSYTAENRAYLSDLCLALQAFPLVVEFRNDEWYRDRVFEELEKRAITLALLDRPDLKGLPPETSRLTTSTVYLRLHGRNTEQWWKGDATSRYDYDYSREELKEKARLLIGLSKHSGTIYVAFNNHAKANATKNARELQGILKELSI